MGGVVDFVGDIFDGITGRSQAKAAKQLAAAQEKAQQQALAAQQREAQLQQQETNKLNASSPQYTEDGFYDAYDYSDILTGATGLSKNDYTLGKNSLLGQGNNTNSSSQG